MVVISGLVGLYSERGNCVNAIELVNEVCKELAFDPVMLSEFDILFFRSCCCNSTLELDMVAVCVLIFDGDELNLLDNGVFFCDICSTRSIALVFLVPIEQL